MRLKQKSESKNKRCMKDGAVLLAKKNSKGNSERETELDDTKCILERMWHMTP